MCAGWFLVWLLLLQEGQAMKFLTYKSSVGLLFVHEDNMVIRSAGQMDLHFMIANPKLADIAKEIYRSENVNIACHLAGSGQELCLYLRNTTRLELKQLQHLKQDTARLMDIHDDLLKQFSRFDNVKKRAWLPISGVLKTVFGTAKASEVAELRAQVKAFSANAKALDKNYDSLYESFKEISNITMDRINNVVSLVRNQDVALLAALKNLDRVNDKINDFMSFASPAELNCYDVCVSRNHSSPTYIQCCLFGAIHHMYEYIKVQV